MIKILSTIASCVLAIALVGCGGGSSTPTPTPTPVPAVTVTPSSATVVIGGSQTFSSPTAGVTWSVTGPGTINQNGVYLAPATFPGQGQNTATITATAGGSSGKSTATVVFANDHQSFQSGPIKLGTSGGNVNDVNTGTNGGCCIGTMGSLWTRGTGTFILSNNHVLDESSFGTNGQAINQPGPSLCFAGNKTVANLADEAPLKPTAGSDPTGCKASTAPFCGSSPSNTDAAIAQVVAGEVDPTGAILDFGAAGSTSIAAAPPSATLFTGPATPGQQVAKSGRTSALTCSTIQAVNGDFFVDYFSSCGATTPAFSATFHNQLVVNGANFIQAGDSGSLLVTADTARPMGLLFASGPGGAIANPIQDVITALTQAGPPAVVPAIVGGADHAISCAPTQSVQGTQTGIGSASVLTPEQHRIATSARDRHAAMLLSDPAVGSVTVGASADSRGDGAVVIALRGTPKTQIPATLDGVRTKVVYQGTAPALTRAALESSIAIKQAHRDAMMSSPGIQGIAVGRSDDNPAEPAILIYTITGVRHNPIPAVMDGVRTKVIDTGRFIAR